MTPLFRPLRAARNAMFVVVWRFSYRGQLIDLTGYSARLQVRRYQGASGGALMTLGIVTSPVHGIRIPDPSSGEMEMRFSASALQALPAGVVSGDARKADDALFAFDHLVTDPTGLEQPWVTGILTTHSGVTY